MIQQLLIGRMIKQRFDDFFRGLDRHALIQAKRRLNGKYAPASFDHLVCVFDLVCMLLLGLYQLKISQSFVYADLSAAGGQRKAFFIAAQRALVSVGKQLFYRSLLEIST